MSEKVVIPGTTAGITVPEPLGIAALEQQIVDFVEGRSDGAQLMLAIYGNVADEPLLPPRLAALLERWRASVALRQTSPPGAGRP